MEYYRVLPNLEKCQQEVEPYIEGEHEWHLPSVKCNVCGAVWGDLKLCYPWIDPSRFKNRNQFRGIRVVPVSEFAETVDTVRRLLPLELPLAPYTLLGVFKGKHSYGTLEDFYFYYGQQFLSRKAFDLLESHNGFTNGTTPIVLKGKKGVMLDYMELHILPRATLAVPKVQKQGQKYCSVCGFDQRSLPEPLVLHRSSIPTNEDLFSLKDDYGVRIGSERFVKAVKSLGLTGLEFQPVEIVDS